MIVKVKTGMAFISDNNAYDISLFDTANDSSARKYAPKKSAVRSQNKVVKLPKRKIEQIRRRRHNPAKLIAGFTLSSIVVAVIAVIIFGQVRLTELNQKIKDAEETLSNSQSTYTQMQMNVDAKYTTLIVDDYAQNKLGMVKATNSQKEFIELSQGDKAEVITDKEKSLIDKIAEAITSLWS